MDETGAYYTEWSKPERKTPIQYTNAFLWDWNENWPFPSPVATAEFSKFAGILSAALSQHHLSGIEITQLEFLRLKEIIELGKEG